MIEVWTRNEYYSKKWKKVYWEDDCPFCKTEEQEWHTIWKWKYWYILHNLYPYTWDERHLMVVPYVHKKYYLELTDEEILDYKNACIFIREFYWDKNYFSCLRETMANKSIEHLHYHFISWKLQWKYLRKMLMDQWFPIIEDLS